MTPEHIEVQHFVGELGTDDGALLRQVAAWVDAEPDRVLIGLWSTGFGEPWQTCLQVITSRMPPEADAAPEDEEPPAVSPKLSPETPQTAGYRDGGLLVVDDETGEPVAQFTGAQLEEMRQALQNPLYPCPVCGARGPCPHDDDVPEDDKTDRAALQAIQLRTETWQNAAGPDDDAAPEDDDVESYENVQAGVLPGNAVDAPPVLATDAPEVAGGPDDRPGPGTSPTSADGKVEQGVDQNDPANWAFDWPSRDRPAGAAREDDDA